jgi:ABC-type transport system involved in multi-copper enzyme maturation permease subunit
VSPLLALLGRSFRRSRWLLASLAGVLALFQVLVVLAASYLQEQQGFSQIVAVLPVMAQQFLGGIFSSFGAMVAVGYFHPVVVIAFVGVSIAMASEPSADLESGVVDLVLARPVRRSRLVTRSILFTAFMSLGLVVMMVTTTAASLALIRPAGSNAPVVRSVVKLAANLLAVAWCLGALSLAASAILKRRATAAGSAGIVALALYLLNALADLSSAFRRYGPYSPFHYFQPMAIISGSSRWQTDSAWLLTVAAALSAIAYAAWSRRDL